MEDQSQAKFQEYIRNPLVWLGAAGALILLIIIVVTLSLIFRKNPFGNEIRIDNLDEYVSGLPQEKRDAMFNMLYSRVQMELGENTSVSIPSSGAMLRPGSHNSVYDEEAVRHSGSFLVDIDELAQTYYVQYEWSDKGVEYESSYPVLVTCPRPEQITYPDFKCNAKNDALSSTDPAAILDNNTPYYGTTQSGHSYYVQSRYYSGGSPYAEVDVNSCGSQSVLSEAEDAAKTWLNSIGVDTDIIPIQMRGLCDGGA